MKKDTAVFFSLGFGFLVIGLSFNLLGSLLPRLRESLDIGYDRLGLLVAAIPFGVLIGVVPSGLVGDRIGKGILLLAGSVVMGVAFLVAFFCRSFLPFLISLGAAGVGFGILETGLNSLVSDISKSGHAEKMNVMHFFFGAGSLVGPLVCMAALGVFRWSQLPFLVVVALASSLLLVTILNRGKLPHGGGVAPSDGVRPDGALGPKRTFVPPKPALLIAAAVAAFLYVAIETTTFSWLPAYWLDAVGGTENIAPLLSSLFWVFLTIGRLLAGRVAGKLGFERYLLFTAVGLAIVYGLWTLFPIQPLVLVFASLSGLLCSGFFPTMVAGTNLVYPGHTGGVSAILLLFIGVGATFSPALVGFLADRFGTGVLPLVLAAEAVLLIVAAFVYGRLRQGAVRFAETHA